VSLALIFRSAAAVEQDDTFTHTLLGDTANYPYIKVEVAFGHTAFTWTELTTYTRALSLRRGRNDELGRVEAGTLEVVLDNRDGRFDPTNTASPYYPYVLPLRQIRVRAQWDGVKYDLFRGYVEAWPMTWPAGGYDDVVTLRAVDAFKSLNLSRLNMAFDEALASDRIIEILNAVDLPDTSIYINTADHTVAETGTLNTSALEHVLTVADSEGGMFFADAGGTLRFHHRSWRRSNETAARGTVGDNAGELNYRDLRGEYDDTYIRNRAVVTWSAGAGVTGGTEIVTDEASTATYGIRGYDLASELARAGEAASIASYQTWKYADPQLRFPQVVFTGASSPTLLWPTLLGAEFGQRYTVVRRPPDGRTITQDIYVEGMQHTITPDEWATTWNVSPLETDEEFWTLGAAAADALDTDTGVGY
jgi:hypothetical protein